jgi:hypothetical protein
MSDETDALKAEVRDLKEQLEAMKRLLGDNNGSLSRLKITTEGMLGPFGSLVDATKSGVTGMSAYNDTLGKTGESAQMLTGFLGKFGEGLELGSGALVKYAQMVNVQSDELYKSYQGLSSVGAAGKADLQSIMNTAKQFGAVSERDLPKFTQMVSQNSETLAKFGGTVAEGLKTFGNVSAEIQQSGLQTQFMNMGMTVDSINKGMAGYLKIQTQSGAAQKMTTEELAAGAADYLKNLDVLSKLTGKSGDAIQKEREERLMNEQYSLHQRELQQKADAGDMDAKRKLAEEDKVLSQTSGDARKGFMAAFSGMGMQTEEGRKLYMSAPEAFKMAASQSGVESGKILDSAKSEFGKTMDNFGGVMMAAGNKLFVNVSDMRATENLKGTAEEREKEAKRQQQEQIERTGASVAAQTALTQEQRKATENLTNFVTKGIEPVQLAMINLATAARGVTDLLPGAKGEASAGATAAEKRKFDELQQRQRTEQGIGPPKEGGPGSQAGQKPTAEKPTLPGGKTYEQIRESANKQAGELSKLIDTAKTELTAKMTELTGGAKDAVSKLIDWVTKSKVPMSAAPSASGGGDSGGGSGGGGTNLPNISGQANQINSDNMTANINQGVFNVASVDGMKFPSMDTSYKPNIDTDTSKFVSMKEAMSDMAKFAGTSTDKTTNADVVASNALVAAKMDELIGLMRTSNGYQQKISQQTYA